jgi:hypothetical protein
MNRRRYFLRNFIFCGLLIATYEPAEARGGGGGGHVSSHNDGLLRQGRQAYRPTGRDAQRSHAYVLGPWANWQFPSQHFLAHHQIATSGKLQGGQGRYKSYYTLPPAPSESNAVGGPGAMSPMTAAFASPYTAASVGQFRYSCTINRNQPEAGGACIINSSTRKYSGDRCSCHGQAATID